MSPPPLLCPIISVLASASLFFTPPPHFGSNSELKIIIWRCCCFAHILCPRHMKSAWWILCVHVYLQVKYVLTWTAVQFYDFSGGSCGLKLPTARARWYLYVPTFLTLLNPSDLRTTRFNIQKSYMVLTLGMCLGRSLNEQPYTTLADWVFITEVECLLRGTHWVLT